VYRTRGAASRVGFEANLTTGINVHKDDTISNETTSNDSDDERERWKRVGQSDSFQSLMHNEHLHKTLRNILQATGTVNVPQEQISFQVFCGLFVFFFGYFVLRCSFDFRCPAKSTNSALNCMCSIQNQLFLCRLSPTQNCFFFGGS
jgi:hypothetical protein